VSVEDSLEEIKIYFALVVLTEKLTKIKEKTNSMPLSKRCSILKQDTVMKKWNKILFCFLETENKYQVAIVRDNRN
jgi:hypothetical protein